MSVLYLNHDGTDRPIRQWRLYSDAMSGDLLPRGIVLCGLALSDKEARLAALGLGRDATGLSGAPGSGCVLATALAAPSRISP